MSRKDQGCEFVVEIGNPELKTPNPMARFKILKAASALSITGCRICFLKKLVADNGTLLPNPAILIGLSTPFYLEA